MTVTYNYNDREYEVIFLMGKPLPCCATYIGCNIMGDLWLGTDDKLYIM